MNIVYGVSGEGLGHVYEALEIASFLVDQGHRVKLLTYGERAVASLARFGPTQIEGVHLVMGPAGLSLGRTVSRNLRVFPFYARNWGRLRDEIEGFGPDVCLTAYEPFTTYMAHALGLGLVSMDNQNELLHVRAPAGTDGAALALVRLATRVCTYGADRYVVKSLRMAGKVRDRAHFVAPVIQRALRRLGPAQGSHVLVYLTKENPRLLEILKTLDGDFRVYCHNRVGTDANLTFRAQGDGYLEDLRSCRAIIATTGFSLVADSVFLGKPYFGVPLAGQYEQMHNALFLRESGFGDFREKPLRSDIERFLDNLPAYRGRLAGHSLDPAQQERVVLRMLEEAAQGVPSARQALVV